MNHFRWNVQALDIQLFRSPQGGDRHVVRDRGQGEGQQQGRPEYPGSECAQRQVRPGAPSQEPSQHVRQCYPQGGEHG
jgi:hypothetical protein